MKMDAHVFCFPKFCLWYLISFDCLLQAALKKSNLELEADLKVKLNNIEMLNEAAQMKDKIIKVVNKIMFCSWFDTDL